MKRNNKLREDLVSSIASAIIVNSKLTGRKDFPGWGPVTREQIMPLVDEYVNSNLGITVEESQQVVIDFMEYMMMGRLKERKEKLRMAKEWNKNRE